MYPRRPPLKGPDRCTAAPAGRAFLRFSRVPVLPLFRTPAKPLSPVPPCRVITRVPPLSIIPLLWHNPPHSAPGVPDIAGIPGDHVAMAVHNGLPGCLAHVDPDVVTGRLELFPDDAFAHVNEGDHRLFFLNKEREEIRLVPERDHEQVPPADREPVPAGIAEIVLCDNLIRDGIAERAFLGRHHTFDLSTQV